MTNFPVPVTRNDASSDFFAATARGTMQLRRCDHCGTVREAGETACPRCCATPSTLIDAAGTGKLVTCSVVHRTPLPGAATPYVVGLIELDEGPWVIMRILNADAQRAPHAGDAIDIVFAATGGETDRTAGERIPAATLAGRH